MYIRETQSADWFKDGIFCWGRTESTRKSHPRMDFVAVKEGSHSFAACIWQLPNLPNAQASCRSVKQLWFAA
jgi:hypothetical protein